MDKAAIICEDDKINPEDKSAALHIGGASPMSAMWLVPQLALGGLAEVLNAIGQLEFYYKQFPENMRVVGPFFFLGSAALNYAYSFLISTVHRMTAGDSGGNWLPEDLNQGRLDYFYYLVAILCSINFCYFLVCANWYRYKTTDDHDVTLVSPNKLDHHSA
ncbi:protein NRT1/ PTR FAMILY 2.11-like [Salvia splendens]|uniref:protein NRT1/ PTR FAMILY 2.11-like n=1 Tax=Salvia splendens TaxID=180675 RepID=UPI001C261F67|nr:protein NRT1/ PTR FAMILY 2.11-like [Salvia splendens]